MISVITGTMASSKSKTLIDYTEFLKDKKCKIFVPACCQRKDGYVTSRNDNREVKAIKIFNINDLYNNLGDCEVLIIDEVQFLIGTSEIDEFMLFLEYIDKKNIDLYMFGLNLDYLSNSFNLTQRILPYADSIITLTAICDECGKPACRCLRYIDGELDINPDSETLLLESNDVVYKSVCRTCYRKLTGLNAIK